MGSPIGTIIFPPDDSDPVVGMYMVRLRKLAHYRALGIFHDNGVWVVYVDGLPVARPSVNWREAFGYLYKIVMLNGIKITTDEYRDLVAERMKDALNNVDPNSPINHNQSKVAI